MSLSKIVCNVSSQWQYSRSNTGGFLNTTQGTDSLNWNLSGINLSTWNQQYVTQLSLAGSGSTTLDLTSLTNLVYESFTFAHVLMILVLPVGNSVTVEPGATNGLTWFFGGTTPSITIPSGGVFLFSAAAGATGQVVDSTHRTLTFVNASGAANLVDVQIIGSTV